MKISSGGKNSRPFCTRRRSSLASVSRGVAHASSPNEAARRTPDLHRVTSATASPAARRIARGISTRDLDALRKLSEGPLSFIGRRAREGRDVDGSARRAEEIRRRRRAAAAARGVEEEEGGAAEAPVDGRAQLPRWGGLVPPVGERRLRRIQRSEDLIRVRGARHADVPTARRARGGSAVG